MARMEVSNRAGIVRRLRRGSLIALTILASVTAAAASTFTVTTTADSGAGSLRQAITDSNANPPPANTTNLINFNITGASVHTITPASALPTITQPVVIDGFTQTGSSANTHATNLGDNSVHLIEIDGMNTGGGNGTGVLTFTAGAGGSTIRGLVINRGPDA